MMVMMERRRMKVKVEFCLKRKISLIFFLLPACFVASLSYNKIDIPT